MIATTINSSISEKPREPFFIRPPIEIQSAWKLPALGMAFCLPSRLPKKILNLR
jgi:hypothetical protein